MAKKLKQTPYSWAKTANICTDQDLVRARVSLGLALEDKGWRLFGMTDEGWKGVATKAGRVVLVGVKVNNPVLEMSGRGGWPVFHPTPTKCWGWHVEDKRGILSLGKQVSRCQDRLAPGVGFLFAYNLAQKIDDHAYLRPADDPSVVPVPGAEARLNVAKGGIEIRLAWRWHFPLDLFTHLSKLSWRWQKYGNYWYAPICELNLLLAERITGKRPAVPA